MVIRCHAYGVVRYRSVFCDKVGETRAIVLKATLRVRVKRLNDY